MVLDGLEPVVDHLRVQAVHEGERAVQPTVVPFSECLKAAKRASIVGAIGVDLLNLLIGYDKVIAILILGLGRGESVTVDGHYRTDADEFSGKCLGQRGDDRDARGVEFEGEEEVLQFGPVVAVAAGRTSSSVAVVAQLRVGTEQILHHVLRARRAGN